MAGGQEGRRQEGRRAEGRKAGGQKAGGQEGRKAGRQEGRKAGNDQAHARQKVEHKSIQSVELDLLALLPFCPSAKRASASERKREKKRELRPSPALGGIERFGEDVRVHRTAAAADRDRRDLQAHWQIRVA